MTLWLWMSVKRNVSVCRGHELANALYVGGICKNSIESKCIPNALYEPLNESSSLSLMKMLQGVKKMEIRQSHVVTIRWLRKYAIQTRKFTLVYFDEPGCALSCRIQCPRLELNGTVWPSSIAHNKTHRRNSKKYKKEISVRIGTHLTVAQCRGTSTMPAFYRSYCKIYIFHNWSYFVQWRNQRVRSNRLPLLLIEKPCEITAQLIHNFKSHASLNRLPVRRWHSPSASYTTGK